MALHGYIHIVTASALETASLPFVISELNSSMSCMFSVIFLGQIQQA